MGSGVLGRCSELGFEDLLDNFCVQRLLLDFFPMVLASYSFINLVKVNRQPSNDFPLGLGGRVFIFAKAFWMESSNMGLPELWSNLMLEMLPN